jgi:hypothetical protein
VFTVICEEQLDASFDPASLNMAKYTVKYNKVILFFGRFKIIQIENPFRKFC